MPESVTVTPPPPATRALVQVPAPTATAPTAEASPTAEPLPATATSLPTAQPTATTEPTPEPTAASAFPGLPDFTGAAKGNFVPMPLIAEGATTGFTTSVVISTVSTVISGGVSITVVTPLNLNVVPPPVAPVQLPEGTINIALLGTDTRPQQGGLNTDVIIIASLHPTLPVATLLSIPRDTLVYIPNQRMHKVNTAFRYGGKDYGEMMFKQTIKYNFGINIDYFALVNFTSVVNAVNTVGGIEVVATCPLYQVFPRDPYYFADEANPLVVAQTYTDTFTGEVWEPGTLVPTQTIWIPRAGVYELNGLQTLAFARARYGVPGGDLDRGRRAQRVIRALLNKVRQGGSITKIPELYAQFERSVRTDLALTDILALATTSNRMEAITFHNRFLEGVGLLAVTLPSVGAVLIPNRENVSWYVQRALTVNDNVRANDGVPVELWNATPDEDFGVAAADRLRELGFLVVDIQNIEPANASQIVDFSTSTKGSALPLLLRSFGIQPDQVSAEPQEMSNGARYRIVAGRDFDPCYQAGAAFPGRSANATATPSATGLPDAVAPTVEATAAVVPAATETSLPAQPPPTEAPPAPAPAATAAP